MENKHEAATNTATETMTTTTTTAATTTTSSNTSGEEIKKESNNNNNNDGRGGGGGGNLTKWTDDKIRWSDCEDSDDDGDNDNNSDDDDDDEAAVIDPFKDPDPTQIFSFQFANPNDSGDDDDDSIIDITLKGYKADTDEVWKSTGVTLWKASKHLCDYMLEKYELFSDKNVLELGAGLGLNGILAHHLQSSHVYVTDGDINAVLHLRQNIEANNKLSPEKSNDEYDGDNDNNGEKENNNKKNQQHKISGEQLLWGKDTSTQFLNDLISQHHPEKTLFDIILASDIIYSPVIIPPLWETLHVLLQKPDGVLIMAFARREVKVTIEYVLQSAIESGFVYERVDNQNIDGIFIYEFRWKNEE